MKVYVKGKGPVEVIAFHSTGDRGIMLSRDGDDFYVNKVKPGAGWGIVELIDPDPQEPVDNLQWAREAFDMLVEDDPVYAPSS